MKPLVPLKKKRKEFFLNSIIQFLAGKMTLLSNFYFEVRVYVLFLLLSFSFGVLDSTIIADNNRTPDL